MAFAAAAQRGAGELLGRRPAGGPDRRTVVAALKRGGVDSVRIPIDWGAVQPTRNGPSTGPNSTPWSSAPPTPGSRCCRSSPAPRPGRCRRPPCRAPAARPKRRRTCRSTGTAGDRLVELRSNSWSGATARTAPSGPQNPGVAEAADPHLADLERAQLQVLRRPSQPGRIRQAGEALLSALRSADPGAKVILAGLFARPKGGKAKSRRTAPTPRNSSRRCTRRRRGSSPNSPASPCTLHGQLPGTDAGDRRNPQRPDRQPRRGQGPLDHRARLELAAAAGEPAGKHLRQRR